MHIDCDFAQSLFFSFVSFNVSKCAYYCNIQTSPFKRNKPTNKTPITTPKKNEQINENQATPQQKNESSSVQQTPKSTKPPISASKTSSKASSNPSSRASTPTSVSKRSTNRRKRNSKQKKTEQKIQPQGTESISTLSHPQNTSIVLKTPIQKKPELIHNTKVSQTASNDSSVISTDSNSQPISPVNIMKSHHKREARRRDRQAAQGEQFRSEHQQQQQPEQQPLYHNPNPIQTAQQLQQNGHVQSNGYTNAPPPEQQANEANVANEANEALLNEPESNELPPRSYHNFRYQRRQTDHDSEDYAPASPVNNRGWPRGRGRGRGRVRGKRGRGRGRRGGYRQQNGYYEDNGNSINSSNSEYAANYNNSYRHENNYRESNRRGAHWEDRSNRPYGNAPRHNRNQSAFNSQQNVAPPTIPPPLSAPNTTESGSLLLSQPVL